MGKLNDAVSGYKKAWYKDPKKITALTVVAVFIVLAVLFGGDVVNQVSPDN